MSCSLSNFRVSFLIVLISKTILLYSNSLEISSGKWELVESFNAGGITDWTLQASGGTDADWESPGLGTWAIVTDPFGNAANEVVQFRGGDGSVPGNILLATGNLNSPVKDGEVGTIYFKFAPETDDVHAYLGISDANQFDLSIGPSGWFLFQSVIRLDSESWMKIGSSNILIPEFTQTEILQDKWYEVWMVIHNRESFEGPDYYEIWIKGGAWNNQTQLRNSINGTGKFPFFTGSISSDIQTIVLASDVAPETVLPLDEWSGSIYLDNFYRSAGVNLSHPWGDGLLLQDQWVLTNTLGWVYVNYDPWVYSERIGKYLYLSKYNQPNGWVFFPNE